LEVKVMTKRKMWIPVVGALLAAGAVWLGASVAIEQARACGYHHRRYYHGPSSPVVVKKNGEWDIRLSFQRQEFYFKGGKFRFSEVRLFTKDVKLGEFLEKNGMANEMWEALKPVATRRKCHDMYSGRAIASFEQELTAAIARHYRAKTKRAAGAFSVMFVADLNGWRHGYNGPGECATAP
jgi:hypothetical protein